MPTAIDVFAKVRGHEREEQLRAAREADVLPYFRRLEGPAGPVVEMEGAERIMLGSNNYLGLTGDPRVTEGARAALERYGTGLTGSRLLNGTIDLHLELEAELAAWMGTEDAIVFTTGHQANVGTLGTILGPGDTVIADSADHASILDGCLLSRAKLRPFRHGRLDKLEKMLQRAGDDGGGVLVVVDGVFSMEGDIAELPRIVELAKAHGARLSRQPSRMDAWSPESATTVSPGASSVPSVPTLAWWPVVKTIASSVPIHSASSASSSRCRSIVPFSSREPVRPVP
jgi:8-amino-7-oxononanoate synthase